MLEPVSVIITCYNLEHYIENAVRSALAQNYQGEVQIVVVDDCSTDQSRSVLEKIPGIEIVHLCKNGGVMKAMIAGLRVVRHDIVFFLDGDDLWAPEKLSRCVEKIDKGTKLCTHDLWYIDAEENVLHRESRVSAVLSSARVEEQNALIERCIFHHLDYVWWGSAFGIRRSLCEVPEFIRFCESRDYLDGCYQDWPLAAWVATRGRGVMKYVDMKLFGYRIHGENYSGSTKTLGRLKRNLSKSLCTAKLIEEIVTFNGCEVDHIMSAKRITAEYELLLSSLTCSRINLSRKILKDFKNIARMKDSPKLILKLLLAIIFGPRGAHFVSENLKKLRTL